MPDQAYVRLLIKKPDGTSDEITGDGQGRFHAIAHPSIGEDVAAGCIFLAGAQVSLAANQIASLHIENPGASGKTLIILGFTVFVDQSESLRVRFWEDAASTGAAVTPHNLNFASSEESIMVVKSGQGVLSGGEELPARVRVTRDSPFRYEGAPVIVPPGKTVALDVTAPSGLGGNATVAMNASWKES